MDVIETFEALRAWRRAQTGSVGLVPTMGYLHAGHLALADAARKQNDRVIATIFVNPTQFSATEDLSTYPRDLPRDLRMLESAGVDVVFTPQAALMYPPRFQTYVMVEEVSQGREGAARPTHFRGVATVVAKLFNLTQADRAYFGQKDAQQVVVVRQMVRDLNFGLEVVVCPIVRETDGLAMSSRNVYLSADERLAAGCLSRALRLAGERYERGERDPRVLRRVVADVIDAEPLAHLDYVSVAEAMTLRELDTPIEGALLVSLTARIGKPRLLDNCLFPLDLNTMEGATSVLGAG